MDTAQQQQIKDLYEQDRIKFVYRFPFVGQLLLSISMVPDTEGAVHLAAVDGQRLWLSPEYCTLSEDARLALLNHEMYHILLGHVLMPASFDLRCANLAQDVVINRLLEQGPATEHGMKELGKLGCVRTSKLGFKVGLDKDEIEFKVENLSSKDWVALYFELQSSAEYKGLKKQWKQDVRLVPDADRAQVQRRADSAKSRAVQYGLAPAGMDLQGELQAPAVPWQKVLRRELSQVVRPSDYGHRYQTRKLHLGYIRTLDKKEQDIVYALDTSGSMKEDVGQGLSELKGLLQSVRCNLHFLSCDTQATHLVRVRSPQMVSASNLPVVGGGGTDFRPIFDKIETELMSKRRTPSCLIVFTDGVGVFPKHAPSYPVIWVSTSRTTYPWGRVVSVVT
jgi:predicted metal-dependent peptidase